MTHALFLDGAWRVLPSFGAIMNADGIAVSAETFALWSEMDRESFGARLVPEPGDPPAGKVEVARELHGVDGAPAWVVTYADVPKPGPEPVPDQVSETQFMRAATRMQLVTGDEAEDYLARGVIPVFVALALEELPASERTDNRLKVIGANTFERADPVFALLIAREVATAGQVDDLFRLADTLV